MTALFRFFSLFSLLSAPAAESSTSQSPIRGFEAMFFEDDQPLGPTSGVSKEEAMSWTEGPQSLLEDTGEQDHEMDDEEGRSSGTQDDLDAEKAAGEITGTHNYSDFAVVGA